MAVEVAMGMGKIGTHGTHGNSHGNGNVIAEIMGMGMVMGKSAWEWELILISFIPITISTSK
jgi:hypothetical protein